ncbi:hypothetical protein SOCE26_091810 [Sorangium cellulosum]|uniref:Uncharacterized protein n=1 Tax=Sorangium cellulosum TaxID=56 RepID=A0A2L0F8A2_SORCE|nr:hypothetical protein [Sorangium cellulosum]AUX47659.1 hypothetical protein SOCE26_091810 [Sorangium cellulosum]
MRSFIATMVYDLHPDTPLESRKLLRAHLVGRRWQDRHDGAPMPQSAVWIRRSAEDDQTTDDLHAACARDLREAAAAVAQAGRPIQVMRVWIQVSGAGTYGLARPAPAAPG